MLTTADETRHQLDAEAADALGGPDWLRQRRAAAVARAASLELPSPEEEVWRYSRVGEIDLAAWAPPAEPGPAEVPAALTELLDALPERAATVVVRNGTIVLADVEPRWADAGLEVGHLVAFEGAQELLGSVAGEPVDVFGWLNEAFVPDPVLVRVPAGLAVEEPVVVVDWIDVEGALVPSRLVVSIGADAEVSIVDWHGGSDVAALALPVVELDAGPASRLRYCTVQDRGPRTMQIAEQASQAGQEATLTAAQAALGGDYARSRADCRLVGRGAHAELDAVYFGEGTQSLDFRTFQDHMARDTTSDLRFYGAVSGTSQAIYTGTIHIGSEAAGTVANQTNRNLKLSEGAWAESVPNLEIENNDVRCSHASTVGPVDADQVFYLESRGVPTVVAEQLIVGGFFEAGLSRLPVRAAADLVRAALARRLEARDWV